MVTAYATIPMVQVPVPKSSSMHSVIYFGIINYDIQIGIKWLFCSETSYDAKIMNRGVKWISIWNIPLVASQLLYDINYLK